MATRRVEVWVVAGEAGPSLLMVRGILRPRAKGSEGAVAAHAASVIRSSRPYVT